LTGSTDQTARLWDAASGQTIREFAGHSSAILLVGFSVDGRTVLSGDARTTYAWRRELQDVVAFACGQLSRDFSAEERGFYNIGDAAPTCPEQDGTIAAAAPTWTPVPPGGRKESPVALSVAMEFLSEAANVQMGAPVQDVFVDAGNGQVVRPTVLSTETLALPVYSTAVEVPLDIFEAPFDTGPYPKGEPLGFTLGDYIAGEGRGTYTVVSDRAIVELTLEHLVPNGLYTAWCNIVSFHNASIKELACIAPDGTAYAFTADKNGRAEIRMDIAAFPPSTEDAIYEIAFAYHSDGRAYGESAGQHGRNVHGQLAYDFLPPANQ
jgi:hypothetical protein